MKNDRTFLLPLLAFVQFHVAHHAPHGKSAWCKQTKRHQPAVFNSNRSAPVTQFRDTTTEVRYYCTPRPQYEQPKNAPRGGSKLLAAAHCCGRPTCRKKVEGIVFNLPPPLKCIQSRPSAYPRFSRYLGANHLRLSLSSIQLQYDVHYRSIRQSLCFRGLPTTPSASVLPRPSEPRFPTMTTTSFDASPLQCLLTHEKNMNTLKATLWTHDT